MVAGEPTNHMWNSVCRDNRFSIYHKDVPETLSERKGESLT